MPKGEYLQYGGQAIIEGVMMRSPRYFSVACRAPNGLIIVQTEAIEKTWIGRQKWLKFPFLRGSLALLDSMALGIRAMRFASNVQFNPDHGAVITEREGVIGEIESEMPIAAKPFNPKIQDTAIGVTMLISVLIGLLVFNYLPNVIAEYGHRFFQTTDQRVTNFTAEMAKAIIFFAYVGLIGLLPDIREVFKYHGAEHKAINTLEADRPLEIEECLKQTRLHPRCGTSFAIIVLILGLMVFTFLPRYPFGQHSFGLIDATIRWVMELLVLPLIAGVAYELLRLAGKFRNATLVTILFSPGLASQFLTTREPDARQVEVALAALKGCIDAETGANQAPPVDAPVNIIESAPLAG